MPRGNNAEYGLSGLRRRRSGCLCSDWVCCCRSYWANNMEVVQKRFCRRNEPTASLCGIDGSAFPSEGFSDELNLPSTSPLPTPHPPTPTRNYRGHRCPTPPHHHTQPQLHAHCLL